MGVKLSVPAKAHPLVRFLYRAMVEQDTSVAEVAQRSGVARDTLSRWRYNDAPNLANLEAALGVLGYRLRPVCDQEEMRTRTPRLAQVLAGLGYRMVPLTPEEMSDMDDE